MGTGRVISTIVAVSVLATSCSGDAEPPSVMGEETVPVTASVPVGLAATLPLAEEALDDPEVTTVASDLTESQRSAETVPEPDTPGPCEADDLALWTAQVWPGDGVADAVIRVQNTSDDWCEPDIGRSPRLDPAIEPDVWLVPGATADLVVGQMPGDCTDPSPVRQVQIGIGETSVVVPSALVTCGWWLTAFYPNDDVTDPCTADALELAATASAVVMRNASASACSVGGVVSADGAELPSRPGAGVPVFQLLPGDVVVVAVLGDECDAPPRELVVRDALVGDLSVDGVTCDVIAEGGLPRPWFGTPEGPLAAVSSTGGDAEALIDALDPFEGLE